jgi:hypothetical protein
MRSRASCSWIKHLTSGRGGAGGQRPKATNGITGLLRTARALGKRVQDIPSGAPGQGVAVAGFLGRGATVGA